MASEDTNMEQTGQETERPVGVVAELLQNMSVKGPEYSFLEKALQDLGHIEEDEWWLNQSLPVWLANHNNIEWVKQSLLDLRKIAHENKYLIHACNVTGRGSIPVDWDTRVKNNQFAQYNKYQANEITRLRKELEDRTKDGKDDNSSSSKPEDSGAASDQLIKVSKVGGTPLAQQLRDKNKIIRDQEERFKEDCRKFGGDIAKLEKTVTTLKSTITDQQNEATNLNSTIANQQTEITNLRSTVNEQQDSLTAMTTKGTAEFERLHNLANSEIASLRETISQQRDRINAMEAEANQQVQRVQDQAKDQLNTLQQEANDQLNAVKNHADEQFSALQNTVAEQRARLAQHEVKAKEDDEEVARLRLTVTEEQERKKRLADEMTKLSKAVAEGQDEKKKALDEIAKLHESVNGNDKETITKLQDKIKAYETKASTTKADMDKIQKAHELLEDRYNKSQDEIKGLRDDLLQEQKEAKVSASKYTSLKDQYDNLNEELETTETTKNQLSSELDETKEARNALVKELKDTNLYIQNADKQMTSDANQGLAGSIVKKIEALEKALKEKSSEAQLLSDENHELKTAPYSAENYVTGLETNVERLKKSNEELLKTVATLESQHATLESQYADLESQHADQIQASKDLVQSLEDAKAAEEQWKTSYDRKDREVERLRQRLERSTGAVVDSYESEDEEGPAPVVPDVAASVPVLGVELEASADGADFTADEHDEADPSPNEQMPVQSEFPDSSFPTAPSTARCKMSNVRKSAFALLLLAILFLVFALIVSYYRKEKLLGRGDESARLAWNSYHAGGGTGTAWPSWLWDDELVKVPGGMYG